MPPKVIVRPATGADADALADLTRELGYLADAATTKSRIHAILGRDTDLLLVAMADDGSVCGWLQSHVSETLEAGFRAEILGLVVAEKMRRHGVGQQLVAKAEAWARNAGSARMVVRSNLTRTESHAFYTALGYERVKTQAVYSKQMFK